MWYFPLRLDSQLYVQVLFNQIAPDYLEGLLLVLPFGQLPQELLVSRRRLEFCHTRKTCVFEIVHLKLKNDFITTHLHDAHLDRLDGPVSGDRIRDRLLVYELNERFILFFFLCFTVRSVQIGRAATPSSRHASASDTERDEIPLAQTGAHAK